MDEPQTESETVLPWVQLHSGVPFDLLDPESDQVVIADLVRSICRLPRYSAHTTSVYPWTVGAHSMLVADILTHWCVPVAVIREGLVHDLPEAIYGDMPTPVRIALDALGGGDAWRELRRRVDTVVRAELGLPVREHPLVRRADQVALAIERRDLMASCERDWCLAEYAPVWRKLEPSYDVDAVTRAFGARLAELTAAVARDVEVA